MGILAISILNALGLGALGWVRRWNYRLFFGVHVVGSVLFLVVAWFHVKHVRVYVVEAGVVYLWVVGWRWWNRERVTVGLRIRGDRPSEGYKNGQTKREMVEVTFKLPAHKMRKYVPGSHVYVSIPGLGGKLATVLRPANPFTIASVASERHTKSSEIPGPTTLVLRALSGTTSELAHLARNLPKGNATLDIEGPYGSVQYFPDLTNEGRFPSVVLVAGGVGGTFTLPIYIDMLEKRGGRGVRFLWCVKRKEDADWGRELLGLGAAGWEEMDDVRSSKAREEDVHEQRRASVNMVPAGEGAAIFVTSQPAPSSHGPARGLQPSSTGDNSIELEERSNLLQMPTILPSSPNPPLGYYPGRPDFHNEFTSIARMARILERRGKVAVLVCGPKAMARGLRSEVGSWIRQDMFDVWWHEEGFGWD